MKQFTLLFTLAFMLTACSVSDLPFVSSMNSSFQSDKKVKKEYFTGGQVRTEFVMDDDTGRNGVLKKYGHSGKLTSTARMKNAVINGHETGYDESGRMLWQLLYDNGKQHGLQKAFYPNGDIMVTYEYAHGLKHGVAQTYNQDGTVNKRATYSHGKLTN
jgi:antitoxin component YwqK of YwqJK toxin-antitoxin module